jgi:hypothetical protein
MISTTITLLELIILSIRVLMERDIHLKIKRKCGEMRVYQGSITQKIGKWRFFAGPNHELNLYYIGKVGQLDINANATYLWKKDGRNDSWKETSDGFEDPRCPYV